MNPHYKSKFNLLFRSVCVALLLAFIGQDLSYANPSLLSETKIFSKEPSDIQRQMEMMEFPLEYCSVRDMHKGNAGSPLIIHIQDPHSNYSGQKNISLTLDKLMERYHWQDVFVEGSEKDASLAEIKKIADSRKLNLISENMLRDGRIQGEQYLDLTSTKTINLTGVEDVDIYARSLLCYQKLSAQREENLNYLNKIQIALNKLKNKFYPKKLLEYEDLAKKNLVAPQDEESDKLSMLLMLADSQNLEMSNYPNLQKIKALKNQEQGVDFNMANMEQMQIIQQLGKDPQLLELLANAKKIKDNSLSLYIFIHKLFEFAQEKNVDVKQFQNLVTYYECLKQLKEVDTEALLEEQQSLEEQIYTVFLKTSATQDALLVRSIDRYLKLLQTAYKIQMTSGEFKTFLVNEKDFLTHSYLAFINRKLLELGYYEDVISYKNTLDQGQVDLKAFYESIDQRDIAFLKNMDAELDKTKDKTAFLITGGYHTEHLTKLLKDKNYSYIVLTPHVTQETNQKRYEQRLLEPLKVRHSSDDPLRKASNLKIAGVTRISEPKRNDLRAWGISGDSVRELLSAVPNSPEAVLLEKKMGTRLSRLSDAIKRARSQEEMVVKTPVGSRLTTEEDFVLVPLQGIAVNSSFMSPQEEIEGSRLADFSVRPVGSVASGSNKQSNSHWPNWSQVVLDRAKQMGGHESFKRLYNTDQPLLGKLVALYWAQANQAAIFTQLDDADKNTLKTVGILRVDNTFEYNYTSYVNAISRYNPSQNVIEINRSVFVSGTRFAAPKLKYLYNRFEALAEKQGYWKTDDPYSIYTTRAAGTTGRVFYSIEMEDDKLVIRARHEVENRKRVRSMNISIHPDGKAWMRLYDETGSSENSLLLEGKLDSRLQLGMDSEGKLRIRSEKSTVLNEIIWEFDEEYLSLPPSAPISKLLREVAVVLDPKGQPTNKVYSPGIAHPWPSGKGSNDELWALIRFDSPDDGKTFYPSVQVKWTGDGSTEISEAATFLRSLQERNRFGSLTLDAPLLWVDVLEEIRSFYWTGASVDDALVKLIEWIKDKRRFTLDQRDKDLNPVLKLIEERFNLFVSGSRLALPIEVAEPTTEKLFISPIEYGQRITGSFMPFHHMRDKEDWGIGNFETAIKMIPLFKKMGLTVHQILPLIWSDAFNSPYSEASSRAIDLRYISVPMLVAALRESFGDDIDFSKYDQFLEANAKRITDANQSEKIKHEEAIGLNKKALEIIWDALRTSANFDKSETKQKFEQFKANNSDWLSDHMLFLILKEKNQATNPYNGWDWRTWPENERDATDRVEIDKLKEKYKDEIEARSFIQFVARDQFDQYAAEAKKNDIQIAMDIPFARGGADVWMNPGIFGLKKENGYQRPFTHGSLPEEKLTIGQYWQFFAYDWSHPDTLDYFIKLFEHYQKMAPTIRIDHALGFYMPYLFMEDGNGEFSLERLGIFEQVQNIVQKANEDISLDASQTKAIKQKAAEEVSKLFVSSLKQIKNPLIKHLVDLAYPEDQSLSEYAMMYVARQAEDIGDFKYQTMPAPWVRVDDVVEPKVYGHGPVWNYLRLTEHKYAEGSGMISYLFDNGGPKREDHLRVAAYDRGPGEKLLSELLSRAKLLGTTVIFETLARFTPDELKAPHLGAYDYVCSMWGSKSALNNENVHDPRAAQPFTFRTYSLHDTKAMRADWLETSLEERKNFLGSAGIAESPENLDDLSPSVHKALLAMSFRSDSLMLVPNWLDLAAYGDEKKINKPGEKSGQWENRLPITAENLAAALEGKSVTEDGDPVPAEILNAVPLLKELVAQRQDLSNKALAEKKNTLIIRTNPDSQNNRVDIRRFEDEKNTAISPFLIESYVADAATSVSVKLRLLEDGKVAERNIPMVRAPDFSRDGISRYVLNLKANQPGVFEFQVIASNRTGSFESSKAYLYAVAHDAEMNPTVPDKYFANQPQYATNKSTTGARLVEDAAAFNGRLTATINLMDYAMTRNASGQFESRGAFQKLTDEIPRMAQVGIGKLYMTWMYAPSKTSEGVHTVEHAGEHFRTSNGTTVRIRDYRISRQKNSDGTELLDNFGNSFSVYSMLGFNPQMGTEEDFRRLVEKAKEYHIEIVADFIPWLSPDAVTYEGQSGIPLSDVTDLNYKYFFYRRISPKENEEFRRLPEGDPNEAIGTPGTKQAYIRNMLFQKGNDGWCVKRIHAGTPQEEIIFLKHLSVDGGCNVDQVLPNPYHPKIREYYKNVFKRYIDLGITNFRIDLGHVLFKKNTRGYFDELKRMGIDPKTWLIESGMQRSLEFPDGIDPNEGFDHWWLRQKDIWQEVLQEASAHAQKKQIVLQTTTFESYGISDQNEVLRLTPGSIYRKDLFDAISEFVYNHNAGLGNIKKALYELFTLGEFATAFPSNYDQNALMKMIKNANRDPKLQESFMALSAVLAAVGVNVLVEYRDMMGREGNIAKMPGGNNNKYDPSHHPFSPDYEVARVLDPNDAINKILESPLAKAVSGLEALKDFGTVVDMKFLDDSSRDDRFISMVLINGRGDRAVVAIDMYPGSDRINEGARDKKILQIPLYSGKHEHERKALFDLDHFKLDSRASSDQNIVVSQWAEGEASSWNVVNVPFDWNKDNRDENVAKVAIFRNQLPVAPETEGTSLEFVMEKLIHSEPFQRIRFIKNSLLIEGRHKPEVVKQALLFCLEDSNYWIRSLAANALARRTMLYGKDEETIKFKLTIEEFEHYISNPLDRSGLPAQYVNVHPHMPFGEQFNEAHARRNKRYALLWVLGMLLSERGISDEGNAYRDELRVRASELFIPEWRNIDDDKLNNIIGNKDPDEFIGTNENINIAELLRLVYARRNIVEGLHRGNQDRFYWLYEQSKNILTAVYKENSDVLATVEANFFQFSGARFATDPGGLDIVWAKHLLPINGSKMFLDEDGLIHIAFTLGLKANNIPENEVLEALRGSCLVRYKTQDSDWSAPENDIPLDVVSVMGRRNRYHNYVIHATFPRPPTARQWIEFNIRFNVGQGSESSLTESIQFNLGTLKSSYAPSSNGLDYGFDRIPEGSNILCFGSSSTQGYNRTYGVPYPDQLSYLLRGKYHVINEGFPGERASGPHQDAQGSPGGLERLIEVLNRAKPALLILWHGKNDWTDKRSDEQVSASIRAMIQEAKSRGVQVLLMGVPKPGTYTDAVIYQKISQETQIPYLPNILEPLFGDMKLIELDGMHLNQRGNRRVAERIRRFLINRGAFSERIQEPSGIRKAVRDAITAKYISIVRQKKSPVMFSSLDDVFTKYGQPVTEAQLDAIERYLAAGGHFAINSFTTLEWFHLRVLGPLTERLASIHRLDLLSGFHFILNGEFSKKTEIYVFDARESSYRLVHKEKHMSKAQSSQWLLDYLNEHQPVEALAYYSDRFDSDDITGNILTMANMPITVNVGKPFTPQKYANAYFDSDGIGVMAPLSDLEVLSQQMPEALDRSTARSPASADHAWTFFNISEFSKRNRTARVFSNQRIKILVGEGATGFVRAYIPLEGEIGRYREAIVTLTRNETGAYEAILPAGATEFEFWWTGGEDVLDGKVAGHREGPFFIVYDDKQNIPGKESAVPQESILCVGASHTEGHQSAHTGGYRGYLANLLGKSYRFVGDYQDQAKTGAEGSLKHYGVGGQTTSQVLRRMQDSDLQRLIPQDARSFSVLLLCGTNDISTGVDHGTMLSNIRQVLVNIRDHAEKRNIKASVYLGTLLPRTDNQQNFDSTKEYNSKLKAAVGKWAEEIPGVKIVLADTFDAICPSGELDDAKKFMTYGDPWHENSWGYKRAADAWFEAIQKSVSGSRLSGTDIDSIRENIRQSIISTNLNLNGLMNVTSLNRGRLESMMTEDWNYLGGGFDFIVIESKSPELAGWVIKIPRLAMNDESVFSGSRPLDFGNSSQVVISTILASESMGYELYPLDIEPGVGKTVRVYLQKKGKTLRDILNSVIDPDDKEVILSRAFEHYTKTWSKGYFDPDIKLANVVSDQVYGIPDRQSIRQIDFGYTFSLPIKKELTSDHIYEFLQQKKEGSLSIGDFFLYNLSVYLQRKADRDVVGRSLFGGEFDYDLDRLSSAINRVLDEVNDQALEPEQRKQKFIESFEAIDAGLRNQLLAVLSIEIYKRWKFTSEDTAKDHAESDGGFFGLDSEFQENLTDSTLVLAKTNELQQRLSERNMSYLKLAELRRAIRNNDRSVDGSEEYFVYADALGRDVVAKIFTEEIQKGIKPRSEPTRSWTKSLYDDAAPTQDNLDLLGDIVDVSELQSEKGFARFVRERQESVRIKMALPTLLDGEILRTHLAYADQIDDESLRQAVKMRMRTLGVDYEGARLVSDGDKIGRSEGIETLILGDQVTPGSVVGHVALFSAKTAEELLYAVEASKLEEEKKRFDGAVNGLIASLRQENRGDLSDYLAGVLTRIDSNISAVIQTNKEQRTEQSYISLPAVLISEIKKDIEVNAIGIPINELQNLYHRSRDIFLGLARLVEDPETTDADVLAKFNDEKLAEANRQLAIAKIQTFNAYRRFLEYKKNAQKREKSLETERDDLRAEIRDLKSIVEGNERSADEMTHIRENLDKKESSVEKISAELDGQRPSHTFSAFSFLFIDIIKTYFGDIDEDHIESFDENLIENDRVQAIRDRMVKDNRNFVSYLYDDKFKRLYETARTIPASSQNLRRTVNDSIDVGKELISTILLDLGKPANIHEVIQNDINKDLVLVVHDSLSIGAFHALIEKFGSQIKAIITTNATRTAHWILVAAGMTDPPAIVIISDDQSKADLKNLVPGDTIALAGSQIYIHPNQDKLKVVERERKILENSAAWYLSHAHDDTSYPVMANVVPGDTIPVYADGIGLNRTEVWDKETEREFMQAIRHFSENGNESYGTPLLVGLKDRYLTSLDDPATNGKKIVFRSLDIQVDKGEDFMRELSKIRQTNPDLFKDADGAEVRDITGFNFYRTKIGRYILKVQIAAFVLARHDSAQGDKARMRVMFPMVKSSADLDYIQEHIFPEASKFLEDYAIAPGDFYDTLSAVDFGAMIETPEAIDNVDGILAHPLCSFLSVGTNDLTTSVMSKYYTTSRSRKPDAPPVAVNRDLSVYEAEYSGLREPVLEKLNEFAEKVSLFNKSGIKKVEVGFCGAIAGTKEFLIYIDYLRRRFNDRSHELSVYTSVSASAIPEVKFITRQIDSAGDLHEVIDRKFNTLSTDAALLGFTNKFITVLADEAIHRSESLLRLKSGATFEDVSADEWRKKIQEKTKQQTKTTLIRGVGLVVFAAISWLVIAVILWFLKREHAKTDTNHEINLIQPANPKTLARAVEEPKKIVQPPTDGARLITASTLLEMHPTEVSPIVRRTTTLTAAWLSRDGISLPRIGVANAADIKSDTMQLLAEAYEFLGIRGSGILAEAPLGNDATSYLPGVRFEDTKTGDVQVYVTGLPVPLILSDNDLQAARERMDRRKTELADLQKRYNELKPVHEAVSQEIQFAKDMDLALTDIAKELKSPKTVFIHAFSENQDAQLFDEAVSVIGSKKYPNLTIKVLKNDRSVSENTADELHIGYGSLLEHNIGQGRGYFAVQNYQYEDMLTPMAHLAMLRAAVVTVLDENAAQRLLPQYFRRATIDLDSVNLIRRSDIKAQAMSVQEYFEALQQRNLIAIPIQPIKADLYSEFLRLRSLQSAA